MEVADGVGLGLVGLTGSRSRIASSDLFSVSCSCTTLLGGELLCYSFRYEINKLETGGNFIFQLENH